MNKIPLKSLMNTRDLGGYQSSDGRHIKPARIIRSSELFNACEDDLNTLVNDYHLSKIIDLRTFLEVDQRPDPSLPNVEFVHDPIFEAFQHGVTHEDHKEEKNLSELQRLTRMIKSMDGKVDEVMVELYPHFLYDEFAIEHFKDFFHQFLNQTEGSILYHCSQGKDRAGTASMLLLAALGVDEKTIKEDYLATNICYKDKIDSLLDEAKHLNYDNALIEQISFTQGVHLDYIESLYHTIDKHYGNIDNYLKEVIGLSSADINNLKDNYLE